MWEERAYSTGLAGYLYQGSPMGVKVPNLSLTVVKSQESERLELQIILFTNTQVI